MIYKRVKPFFAFSMFICLLSVLSCKKSYDFKFINNSSYPVFVENIKHSDQEDFTLEPNDDKIVTIDDREINFQFGPAALIECDIDTDDKKVVFTDE